MAAWVEMAVTCGLQPIEDFACSVAEHWDGLMRWFLSRISNGVLEAISSPIQAAKRRARGYCTTENLMAIVYLTVGKVDFGLPLLQADPMAHAQRVPHGPETYSGQLLG